MGFADVSCPAALLPVRKKFPAGIIVNFPSGFGLTVDEPPVNAQPLPAAGVPKHKDKQPSPGNAPWTAQCAAKCNR